MTSPRILALVIVALGPCLAPRLDAAEPPARKYSPLRFDEDWSWLATTPPADADCFDGVKYAELGGDWHLTFGGSWRTRLEADWNKLLKGPPNETDDLVRLRAYLSLEVGHARDFRWYAEVRAAETESSDRPVPALFHDDPDVENFFLEGTLASQTKHPVSIRFGRQEMLFGAQRLVSPLDWSNTRRTFDGMSVIARTSRTKTQVFATHPVDHEPHDVDSPIDEQWFWGAHSTFKPKAGHSIDMYVLVQDDDREIYASELSAAKDTLERDTFGARYDYQGPKGFLAETEWAYQTGDIADEDLSAFMGSVTVGKQWKEAPWKPKLTAGADIATGDDDPADGERETFGQLFPLGHAFFGHVDLVGRQNIVAARVQYEAWPAKGLRWETALHRFWLESDTDALYDASGAVVRRDPTGAAGNDVGYELDSLIAYTFKTHHVVSFEAAYFWAGDFIQETGHPSDAWWAWIGYEFKF